MLTYKPLFRLLIDLNMKEKVLAQKASISPATLSKMKRDNAVISSTILAKICIVLNCKFDDIMEIKL